MQHFMNTYSTQVAPKQHCEKLALDNMWVTPLTHEEHIQQNKEKEKTSSTQVMLQQKKQE
jgi:hypothetical protein